MKKYIYAVIVLCGLVVSMQPPKGIEGCKTCPIGLPNLVLSDEGEDAIPTPCWNVCWMNADLQCLFNMNDLNNLIKEITYPVTSLAAEYKKLYKIYREAEHNLTVDEVIPFINFINAKSQFVEGVQQDAQEGMQELLDSLAENQKVKDLVSFTELKILKHPESQVEIKQIYDQPATMLHIPIRKNKSIESIMGDYFTKSVAKNYVYPAEYGAFVGDVDQYLYIAHLSEYLIINPVIFAWDPKGFNTENPTQPGARIKIPITFAPETLNMSPFVFERHAGEFSTHYILEGVVAHSGESAYRGHYIAYVKRLGKWYTCNDSIISQSDVLAIDPEFTPYILIYKRTEEPQQEEMSAENNYEQLVKLAESLQELSQKH